MPFRRGLGGWSMRILHIQRSIASKRLSTDEQEVMSNEPPEVWQSVLAESEHLFFKIAHLPPSGLAE
jgi:hypothetical protein